MLAKNLALALLVAVTLSRPGSAVAQDALPRDVPEKEGVSSSSIMDFVNAANHSKTEFHSFMYLRHGKVIAEGWWNPYSPGIKQSLYSTSKSFTAAAVGFALEEKAQAHR